MGSQCNIVERRKSTNSYEEQNPAIKCQMHKYMLVICAYICTYIDHVCVICVVISPDCTIFF